MRAPKASYGVDGYPYLVGLLGGGSALVVAGVIMAVSASTSSWTIAGAVVGVVGLGVLTPGLLGVRYVRLGKFRLRDRMLDEVSWRGDETVLDVGSGGGLLAIGAAKRLTAGTVVATDVWVAKDLSGNGPDRLRRNAEIEAVSDRIEVRSDPAERLDVADGSVDVVLSTLCLHNIEHDATRRQAVREIARVLRPNGTVVISDLAGVHDDATWLRQDGLAVGSVTKAPGTFPPQKIVTARRTVDGGSPRSS